MRRTRAFGAVIGACALAPGCAASEPAPPEAPVVVASAPIASATAPATSAPAPALVAAPPPATPCERIGREQRAVLQPFFDEQRRAFGAFDGREFVRPFCWPDARGAWAVLFSEPKVTPSVIIRTPFRNESQPQLGGTITLARLGLDGRRITGARRALGTYWQLGGSAFDWNGDGVAELAFPIDDSSDVSELAVHTIADGRIVPYAPAAEIHARFVKDLDGDGRPDLFYTAPFSGELMFFEPMDTTRMNSPQEGGYWLVAHSLPDGTFSRDDEVAKAHALKECPDASLDVDDKQGPEASALPIASAVRCAKLHGVARENIDAFLDKRCKKPRTCLNEPKLRAWAGASVPLKL